MKIAPKLTQTQTQQQKIVMTPKLQQAIKVLMMPQLELKQYIEQELNQNPLLEIEEEYDTALTLEDYDPSPEWNKPEENVDREDSSVDIDWESVFDDMRVSVTNGTPQPDEGDAPDPDIAEALSLQNYLYEQLMVAPFNDEERSIGELIIGNLNDDGQLQLKLFSLSIDYLVDFESGCLSEGLKETILKNIDNIKAPGRKLKKEVENRDLQIKQLNFPIEWSDDKHQSNMSPTKRWQVIDTSDKMTYTVIAECNELNFYELTLDDIAEEVGCPVSNVELVLQKIQNTFEPIGIAYRDLRETLGIQIQHHEIEYKRRNGNTPYGSDVPFELAREIVENHLEDLLNNRIGTISQDLDKDRSEIRKASSWIGTLSPYPGRYYTDPAVKDLVRSPETVQGITPDVKVVEIDGEYSIIPYDNYFPRLRMNPYYISLMRNENTTLDTEAKKWIQKKYSDAMDVLSSIAQRGRTIERVTKAIFEVQSDFLTEGAQSLKPLTLKTVANMAGVHESTVSRVTSNKYVETPIGTYPLKFFFSNKLETTHGNSVSAKHVKAAIMDLISKEDPTKPLSDQAISATLKEKGIVVARRTVQKYREELDILSSRQRKGNNM